MIAVKGETVLLVCPKCKGSTFKLEMEYFNEMDLLDAINNTTEVCTGCGWRSKPTDKDELMRRVGVLLWLCGIKNKEFQDQKRREMVDWEGFEIQRIEL